MLSPAEVHYVRWQNRAFRFYVPARVLVLSGGELRSFNSCAMFCGQQSIETLLKATLAYFEPSTDPSIYGHNWPKMQAALENWGCAIKFPEYLTSNSKIQTKTRYPSGLVPVCPTFLKDIDSAFADLLSVVPCHRHTELAAALKSSRSSSCRYLVRKNLQIRRIRKLVSASA